MLLKLAVRHDTWTQLVPLLLKLDVFHPWERGAGSIDRSFRDQPSAASRALMAFTDADCDSATERNSSALPVYFATCR